MRTSSWKASSTAAIAAEEEAEMEVTEAMLAEESAMAPQLLNVRGTMAIAARAR